MLLGRLYGGLSRNVHLGRFLEPKTGAVLRSLARFKSYVHVK